jgi:hypothetical protein
MGIMRQHVQIAPGIAWLSFWSVTDVPVRSGGEFRAAPGSTKMLGLAVMISVVHCFDRLDHHPVHRAFYGRGSVAVSISRAAIAFPSVVVVHRRSFSPDGRAARRSIWSNFRGFRRTVLGQMFSWVAGGKHSHADRCLSRPTAR